VKSKLKFAMLAALAATVALPLAAQTGKVYRDGNFWVEEITGSMSGARSLRVRTDAGSVTVQGGSQQGFTYTVRKRVRAGSEESARRDLASFRITAGVRNGSATLEGDAERRNYRNFSVDFTVHAPRELDSVRAETDGGSIAVRNIAGRVNAESGGGSVNLSDIVGPGTAETGGGSIDVSNAAGELNLHTGGGSIKISGSKGKVNAETGGGSISIGGAQQSVAAQTGGGSINLQNCGGDVRASTGGGSLEIGEVGGSADLETGGGSIRLASAKGPVKASTGGGTITLYKLMSGARAESGAGSITAEFLSVNSNSALETSVGDVIVYISPNARVTVKASVEMANGHKIRSDFPELKITSEGGEWGPRNYRAEGSLNGGGPVLTVRTSSGNVEFRKANR
jgi:DUF4097 and DUF4098 domain-containing protein YvlB